MLIQNSLRHPLSEFFLFMKTLFYEQTEFKQYLNTNIYSNINGDILSTNFKRTNNIGVFKQSDRKGYLRITTCINGKTKSISSHIIIATCWIENKENKPQVNHINGIKTDNRVENLEWCTAKENTNHSLKNNLQIRHKGEKCFHYGKRGEQTNRAKKVLDTSNGKIYGCLKDVVKDTIYSYKNLSRQLTGERKNKTTFIYL